MKYNQKPEHIPLGPPPGSVPGLISPKKKSNNINNLGILSQRQLRIHFDKLYDVFELDALESYKDKSKNASSFPFQIQDRDINLQTEIPKVKPCEVCNLCLGNFFKKQNEQIERQNESSGAESRNIIKIASEQSKWDVDEVSKIQKLVEIAHSVIPHSTPSISSPISSDQTVFYTCNCDESSRRLSQIQQVDETNQNTTKT